MESNARQLAQVNPCRSENNRTQQAVKTLYKTLQNHISAPSLQAVFDQWCQFYGAVTEYEQWRVKLANEDSLRRMLKAFSIPTEKPDLNKFFFATHTFFAILTKLLAYLIVGRYTDLPTPSLDEWKGLPTRSSRNGARFFNRSLALNRSGTMRSGVAF